MRITSILVDRDHQDLDYLEDRLLRNCPYLDIKGKALDVHQANRLIDHQSPDLVFLDSNFLNEESPSILSCLKRHLFDVILLSEQRALPLGAIQCNTSACILKPIQTTELMTVVNQARQKILERKTYTPPLYDKDEPQRSMPYNDLIGVPTVEGYEFISIQKIVRCEGLEKCTRVVILDQPDIISSYNLGEFKKILAPFGFFPPHRSYLINLAHLKRYHKEGTITMIDNGHIPVARRRKEAFLKNIRKI
ncbi:MAG: response regulator transcription factor [Bacteroidota bacterium]